MNASDGVTQGGGDVNALVTLFPQTDDGNLNATLDGCDVGKTLAANGAGASQFACARHLSHGFGVTQRFAHVGLNAGNELALQLLNEGRHGVFRSGCHDPAFRRIEGS